jgi:hypothetical protein
MYGLAGRKSQLSFLLPPRTITPNERAAARLVFGKTVQKARIGQDNAERIFSFWPVPSEATTLVGGAPRFAAWEPSRHE